jgi:hypothetical protein
MLGIKRIYDLTGGYGNMRKATVAKIRRTDLHGAVSLASVPHLPFKRTLPNASDSAIPEPFRLQTAETWSALLEPLRFRQEVIASLSHLTVFAAAVTTASAASPPRVLLFDPDQFMEELHAVNHALLGRPAPLRATHGIPYTYPAPPFDSTLFRTDSYVLNHQLPLTRPLNPTPTDNDAEPALRVAGLLYLKELVPDFPRNLGGYRVQLALLRHHLGRVVGSLRDADGKEPAAGRRRLLRPLLLWVALVGDVVSRIADSNECRVGPSVYDRAVFADAAAAAVEGVEGGVEGLTEEDMVLSRILDLAAFRGRFWDARLELSKILETRPAR